MESTPSIQPICDEVKTSSSACLSDNFEEEMLSENSGVSSSTSGEEEEDEELQADSPTEKTASEASYSWESSDLFIVEDDKEKPQTKSECEQPNAAEANSSENARRAPSEPLESEHVLKNHTDRASGLLSSFGYGTSIKEDHIGTSETDCQSHRKANLHPALPLL